MLRSCKDSCSWQQDKECSAKQYEIGFMRGGLYARRPMVCIPLTPRPLRPEEDGLLNIEIGSNMIGAKCCLQTSPDSVSSVTPDVFLYGGTGALEITPHSFVKSHDTEELVGWYGVESA
ncbi:hypothetical protein TNCV_4559381 [Trichonephila clavipes]|nr:hypothetical protein TNCV_4559381 [Trichonephila clavipes]